MPRALVLHTDASPVDPAYLPEATLPPATAQKRHHSRSPAAVRALAMPAAPPPRPAAAPDAAPPASHVPPEVDPASAAAPYAQYEQWAPSPPNGPGEARARTAAAGAGRRGASHSPPPPRRPPASEFSPPGSTYTRRHNTGYLHPVGVKATSYAAVVRADGSFAPVGGR